MKNLIIGLLFLTSISAFAQIVEVDPSIYSAMGKLSKAHTESAQVQAIKQEIEKKYNTICKGGTSMVFPDITKRVKYTAKCKGQVSLKLEIKSSFSVFPSCVGSPYSFEVKEISTKF